MISGTIKIEEDPRSEVFYEGVCYNDINWSDPIHSLGDHCPCCGSDGAEGHQSACYYLFSMMWSPRGQTFLRDMIKNALIRIEAKKANNPIPELIP